MNALIKSATSTNLLLSQTPGRPHNVKAPQGWDTVPPNRLYYGDNLDILRSRIRDESVHMCYIDPPFNSKRNYNQIYNRVGHEDEAQEQAFIDTWIWNLQAQEGYRQIEANHEGRFTEQTIDLIVGLHKVLGEESLLAYLVSITLRLVEINRVLVPTGSFFLHCDPNASHYLKLLIDSVFLPNGGDYKNEIIWRRTGSHNARRSFGPIHDVILFYTKSNNHFFKILKRPYMKGHVERRYTKDETGQYKFTSGGNVLTGAGATGGDSGKPWRGFDPSAKSRHWAIPGFLSEQMDEHFQRLPVLKKLDALYEAGFIDIEEGNAWPTPVRYLKPNDGSPVQDIWAYQPYTEGTVFATDLGIDADVAWLGPTTSERIGYQTQKPEGLLERILCASTQEGDTVLDAYCGCGTTVAVAHRLRRNWIGIDITYHSISTILARLEDKFGPEAVGSVAIDGIPRDMASAAALAHKKDDRVRKEFEKWAILTYTNNRGVIRKKKGADGGIDGVYYFWNGADVDSAKMVLQAKSGGVTRKDIAALRGDMDKSGAKLACLITYENETEPMRKDARNAGMYVNESRGIRCPKIRIVRVASILKGDRVELPLHPAATSKARTESEGQQLLLDLKPPGTEKIEGPGKKGPASVGDEAIPWANLRRASSS